MPPAVVGAGQPQANSVCTVATTRGGVCRGLGPGNLINCLVRLGMRLCTVASVSKNFMQIRDDLSGVLHQISCK